MVSDDMVYLLSCGIFSFPRSNVGMHLAALPRRVTAKRSRLVPTQERGNQRTEMPGSDGAAARPTELRAIYLPYSRSAAFNIALMASKSCFEKAMP